MGIPVLTARTAGRQRPGRWTDLLQAEFRVFRVQIPSPHLRHAAVCSIGPEQNTPGQSLDFPAFLCCCSHLCEMVAGFMSIQLTPPPPPVRLISGFYIHPGRLFVFF